MMNSQEYWVQRALQRESEAYQNATDMLQKLRIIYNLSAARLVRSVRKTLGNFMKASGITDEQEAKRLLSEKETAETLAALREEYARTGSQEVLAKLNAQAYGYRISRAQAIRKAIDAETEWINEQELQAGAKRLAETYDSTYYQTAYDTAKNTDNGINFAPLSQRDVTEALANRWKGENYSDRVWKNTHLVADEAGKIIDAGLTSGATIQQMSRDIMDLFDVAYYAAARLVRTEINRMHNDAAIKAYQSMGIEWYTFLATLDARTCSACGALDGKHFKISEAHTGENLPPMHPNDRCTTVSYNPDEKVTGTRIARDPGTGKNYKVSADMTYEQWRKEISEKYGTDTLEKAQKRYTNLKNDTAQQRDMQKVLGKEVPLHIADFQDLKYNKPEEWKLTNYNYRLRIQVKDHPEIVLPNADKLTIDERKYTGYLFNPDSKDGWPKGQAITKRLGYSAENYMELDKLIKTQIVKYPAILKSESQYGKKYEVNMVLKGITNKQAKFKVGVIIDSTGIPKLTTAFIDKMKEVD